MLENVPMSPPHCASCGLPGKYNGFSLQYKKVKVPLDSGGAIDQRQWVEKPNPRAGWGHGDGMRRDHTFHPHDNRSPEADMDRQREAHLIAKLSVDRDLQRSFDHLHAEHLVNDLFKDRRGN